MKTNPEALKALYVAAGGDASAVADAVTSVDVLNKIAVLFGGVGTATTNPDAINNIAAVYTPGFEPVAQADLYNSRKFCAYTDGAILVVGGEYETISAEEPQQGEAFVNVKAPKGKTVRPVFENVTPGYTMDVTGAGFAITNKSGVTGTPFVIGIYTIS